MKISATLAFGLLLCAVSCFISGLVAGPSADEQRRLTMLEEAVTRNDAMMEGYKLVQTSALNARTDGEKHVYGQALREALPAMDLLAGETFELRVKQYVVEFAVQERRLGWWRVAGWLTVSSAVFACVPAVWVWRRLKKQP